MSLLFFYLCPQVGTQYRSRSTNDLETTAGRRHGARHGAWSWNAASLVGSEPQPHALDAGAAAEEAKEEEHDWVRSRYLRC